MAAAYCLSFPDATYMLLTDDGGYTDVYCYDADPYNGPNSRPCEQQCSAVVEQGAPPSFPCGDGNSGDAGVVYTLNREGPYSLSDEAN